MLVKFQSEVFKIYLQYPSPEHCLGYTLFIIYENELELVTSDINFNLVSAWQI